MKTILLLFLLTTSFALQAQDEKKEAVTPSNMEAAKPKEEPHPLYIVDGEKKIAAQKIGEEKKDIDVFLNLNAEDIESIQVFKGKDAIEKYGDEGKNGVILITTKNPKSKKENPKQ